jgi:hypothetical protein
LAKEKLADLTNEQKNEMSQEDIENHERKK